ncbi:MAG: hypothetical protein ACK553_10900 [Planctomycetota bacterium]
MNRSPKRFDIFASAPSSAADPLDSVTSTLTPSASASVPTFDAPDLDYDVKPFFEQRTGGPFAWTSATAFYVAMNRQDWKRRDGEPIDWQREAMRPKAVPVPSTPVPSAATTSTPVPSTPITRAIPTDTPIAKAEIVAAILKAGES